MRLTDRAWFVLGWAVLLLGASRFGIVMVNAMQSPWWQFGQAVDVWPPWFVREVAISLVLFGAGAGIVWWRLGASRTPGVYVDN